MYRLALIALLLACGPSAATLDAARYSRYEVPFSIVWNAVVEEVKRRYPSIVVEDAVRGEIASGWRLVDAGDTDPANRTSANTKASSVQDPTGLGGSPVGNSGNNRFNAVPGLPSGITEANLFRVTVRVKGPPWSVNVEGEGANLQGGLKLAPYKRFAIDEPPWVQTRIDHLTVAIYDRLKEHAVRVEEKKKVERKMDTTAWHNLTDQAAIAIIGSVRKAAAAQDTESLRGYMASDFRWATGADGSADTAVAMWSADPSTLRSLASTLDSGCAADNAGDVVCPGTGAVARFRHDPAGWKFVEFMVR